MNKIKEVKNPSGVGEIKEVIITVQISGRYFDSEAIAKYKNDDYFNKKYCNVDKFDEDINVIRYLTHLIESGELDLNNVPSDLDCGDIKIIRERGYVLVNGKRIYPTKVVREDV